MADRILVIDDDDGLRDSLQLLLSAEGYDVSGAQDGASALRQVERAPFDVILCDLRMPGQDGLELLPELVQRLPNTPILMMSAYGTDELALEAIHRGAYDYLAKPFQPAEALFTIRKARERQKLRRANQLLRREVDRIVGERPVVATSQAMIDLLELMERAAAYKSTVLLTGESGTGKEVLSRAIHAQSPRRDAPFVAVNCGAIPDNLIESELFGHAKGAFTGAERAKRGLFVEADGGTLFLDEIGELPTALQVKLLRVLQEEEIRPVGESKPREVDVRVIAATARDLEKEVRESRFREDLFYRLNVVRLSVPPLRERPKDVPLLIDHFLERFRVSLGKPVRTVADDALERLVAYSWPGNVRELENVIERALILSPSETLCLDESFGAQPRPSGASDQLVDMEREHIRRVLADCDWKIKGDENAAQRLGITPVTLRNRMRKLGIVRPGS